MADFASQEWIDELAQAAQAASCDPSVELQVEQRVTGDDPASWHFTIVDGEISVGAGPADAPTFTLTSSRDTAVAINAGTLSAQRAFLDGALQIGGDVHALIAHRRIVGELAALLNPPT